MPDEVARIGALSNGSNGQRSLESASFLFPGQILAAGAASRNPEPKPKSKISVLVLLRCGIIVDRV